MLVYELKLTAKWNITQQARNSGCCDTSMRVTLQAVRECRKECESNNYDFIRIAYIICSTTKNNKDLRSFVKKNNWNFYFGIHVYFRTLIANNWHSIGY